MASQLTGYLRLMRPANIVTALADIVAGVAMAGYYAQTDLIKTALLPVLLLLLATTGLYGGGVVFNDVFDAELDAVERPERPIPSGLIKKKNAALLGIGLLSGGVLAAFFVHTGFSPSVIIALFIAAAALVYDKWGKHHSFLGPLNMGLCRGLNLLLGMSIVPAAINEYWFIGIVPVLYIAAITMISRGEVHGGRKNILYAAGFLYAVVIAIILTVSYANNKLLGTSFFLALFGVMIYGPLKKSIREPKGPLIGKAVKAGVLALILMNAAWAVAFDALYVALALLLLLPLSLWLAKAFAVT